MKYLCLFYFIQLLQETVADLVFVLSLLMTHPMTSFSPHATHDVKRQNTQYTRPRPHLTTAPSLHRVYDNHIVHPGPFVSIRMAVRACYSTAVSIVTELWDILGHMVHEHHTILTLFWVNCQQSLFSGTKLRCSRVGLCLH